MVTSVDKVKNYLNLSLNDTSRDKVINSLIKPVQNFIVSYCNNKFCNYNNYLTGAFQFIANGKKINLKGVANSIALAKGMDILVKGSLNNDGIYEIKSINGEIAFKLADDEPIYDEDEGNEIFIYRVVFPEVLKLTAIKLIVFSMNKKIAEGITSESISDYSVGVINEYPKALLTDLNIYRKLW